MKTDVSFSDFIDRFRVMDRFNHFEYDGSEAFIIFVY